MESLRRWLPIVLLLLVAGWHVVMLVVWDHSSWGAGAGFGMYSKIDAHPFRFTRTTLTLDGREIRISLPEEVRHEELEWRVLPTEARGRMFADALLELNWNDEGKPSADGRPAERVRVELFALDVDRQAHRVDAVSKRVVEVDR